MKLEKMWVLIYFLVGLILGSYGNLEDGACCPENSLVRNTKTNTPFCWDKEANKTALTSLNCTNTIWERILSSYEAKVVEGKLVLNFPYNEVSFEPGTFCVGEMKRNATTRIRVMVICGTAEEKKISDGFMGLTAIISVIFLLITAVIYAALAELRDLLGKSIINLCSSLACGMALQAAMNNLPYQDMDLCAARGFFLYFFFMASFFWMNAISIQILLSIRRPTANSYSWRDFAWYALYAWGCPAFLTIVMAIVNYIPGTHQRPGIGYNHCWFFNGKLQWQYMYSVMTVLILANICIFIYTSVLLWRLTFDSSQTKVLKFKFNITLRLFVVMGVPWVFEMVQSVFPSHIAWEILDLLNMLQGVFIFLVLVVFRKRVVKAMHKHGWLECVSGPVERWLAVGEDQEDVVQHTIGVTMDEHCHHNFKN